MATAYDLGSHHPNSPSYRDTPDDRSEQELLKEAVDRHLSNAGLLNAIVSPPYVMDERLSVAFDHAQRAYEDSQAQLYRLIEDMTMISATKLRDALSC